MRCRSISMPRPMASCLLMIRFTSLHADKKAVAVTRVRLNYEVADAAGKNSEPHLSVDDLRPKVDRLHLTEKRIDRGEVELPTARKRDRLQFVNHSRFRRHHATACWSALPPPTRKLMHF